MDIICIECKNVFESDDEDDMVARLCLDCLEGNDYEEMAREGWDLEDDEDFIMNY